MRFGFSYIGLIWLLMLYIPNLLWTKRQPENYGRYAKNENRVLLAFERVGEVSVTVAALRGFLAPLFPEPAHDARFLPRSSRDPRPRRESAGFGVPSARGLRGQSRSARLRRPARRRAYRDPFSAPKRGARGTKCKIKIPAHRTVRRYSFAPHASVGRSTYTGS